MQVSGRTKTEVSRKLAEIRRRVEQGQPAQDDRITFREYTNSWLATTLPASDRKQTTKQLYAGLARNHILDSRLAGLALAQLRPASVERLLLDLRAKGLADSTVRQIYTIGRAIGDAAVRDGRMGRNPFALVPRPAVAQREANHLDATEVQQLLDAATDSRYRPLFELMVNTALRRGEALALQWRDVDLDRRTLFVRGTLVRLDGQLLVTEPKSKRARRHVPVSDAAAAILRGLRTRREADRELAADSWVDTGFVFTTQLGQPCEPRNALRALTSAARSAGLGRIGLHTLRHSAATVMLNNGVPDRRRLEHPGPLRDRDHRGRLRARRSARVAGGGHRPLRRTHSQVGEQRTTPDDIGHVWK